MDGWRPKDLDSVQGDFVGGMGETKQVLSLEVVWWNTSKTLKERKGKEDSPLFATASYISCSCTNSAVSSFYVIVCFEHICSEQNKVAVALTNKKAPSKKYIWIWSFKATCLSGIRLISWISILYCGVQLIDIKQRTTGLEFILW